jgi:enoyl-CoA hydratase
MTERLAEPAAVGGYVRATFPAPGATPSVPLRDGVALVTIDRPDTLNALSFGLLRELADTLEVLDHDDACRAIVITGAGDRAFAAGADIKELAVQTPVTLTVDDAFATWDRIAAIRKPLIAAVRGFALGGGCELAMACDCIVAGEDAQFGQPEIRIGVMPGAGGTQRLTRAVGKAKAMELILTGRTIDAREADGLGLVTKVVPSELTVEAALDLAAGIASQPPVAVRLAKEAVNRAFELPLSEGVAFERRAFFLLFASDDQREGMAAFTEKRAPAWRGR